MPSELPQSLTPQYLRQLEQLRLHAKRNYLGTRQGGHLSPKRGHGLEFSDYRKYELGDNPRYIDWGAYARTDKLYIKRFQEEQDLNVLVLLDTSASMGNPIESRKWEMARDIALSISYITLMQQDTLHLAPLGQAQSPSLNGAKAFYQAVRALTKSTPQGQPNFAREISKALARVRFPGMAIVISDFLLDIDQIDLGFQALRAKNFDITAIQVISDSDLDPFLNLTDMVAVDSESEQEVPMQITEEIKHEYSTRINAHQDRLKMLFRQSQVHFSSTVSSASLAEFMRTSLTASGLLS